MTLNLVLLFYFFLILLFSPFHPSDDLLLLTSDAKTYFNTGFEFFDIHATGDSVIRPFLYPIILRTFHFIGGAWLVVFFQFLCWTITAQLIYFMVKRKFPKYKSVKFISLVIYCLNISLITYALHGLTELVSTLLISIILYISLKETKSLFTLNYFLKILLLLSLLTVIKPLFQFPLMIVGIVGGIIFAKSLILNWKNFAIFLLVLSPVIFQMSMMQLKYGKFKVSMIDSYTYQRYLFAQGIREIEHIDDTEQSQTMAQAWSDNQRKEYLMEHKSTYLKLYFTNIIDNIDAYESNLFMTPKYTSDRYSRWMDKYNRLFYLVSLVFVIVFIGQFLIDLFTKRLLENWNWIFLGVLFYYIIFASGISFWQADRLVVFAIPLWICLYLYLGKRIILSKFIQQIRLKFKTK